MVHCSGGRICLRREDADHSALRERLNAAKNKLALQSAKYQKQGNMVETL